MSENLKPETKLKGVGKRKTSIANVLLLPGTGTFEINKKPYKDFFSSISLDEKELLKESLVFLELNQQFDIQVKVEGGGISAQLDAIKLGISKALSKLGISEKQKLSRNSFLYRDSRIKERRKYGLRKARKAPQYSKR